MSDIFDFDNGNGVYDVVTRKDYEKWQEEKQKKTNKKNCGKTIEGDINKHFLANPF